MKNRRSPADARVTTEGGRRTEAERDRQLIREKE